MFQKLSASNFPAASLKALGEVVAKERSCKVVWVVIEVAVVDTVGGRGDEFLDKKREIVGSKTPNSLGPCSYQCFSAMSKDLVRRDSWISGPSTVMTESMI